MVAAKDEGIDGNRILRAPFRPGKSRADAQNREPFVRARASARDQETSPRPVGRDFGIDGTPCHTGHRRTCHLVGGIGISQGSGRPTHRRHRAGARLAADQRRHPDPEMGGRPHAVAHQSRMSFIEVAVLRVSVRSNLGSKEPKCLRGLYILLVQIEAMFRSYKKLPTPFSLASAIGFDAAPVLGRAGWENVHVLGRARVAQDRYSTPAV
jgi:hypothetical protein